MNKANQPATARYLAVEILTKIQQQQAYSNLLLNQTLLANKLNFKDTALLTKIVYGTLQHRLTLKFWLAPFIKNKKVELWVKELLLSALFQLKYLDRIPARAVLDEAIKIAKQKGHDGTRRFVTGVLHAILRHDLPDPQSIKDPDQRSAICFSVPVWFVTNLVEQNCWAKTNCI